MAGFSSSILLITNRFVFIFCTIIGDNVHIAPGAIIAGTVVINNDSLIGMGVTVFLGVKIGKNVVVNNGINVFDDIPDNVIVK